MLQQQTHCQGYTNKHIVKVTQTIKTSWLNHEEMIWMNLLVGKAADKWFVFAIVAYTLFLFFL